ncbi:MAG: hypothetical protein LIO65_03030 [Odoribacter sp.]|nr:hypothetical protein [Odoribacter sp.]
MATIYGVKNRVFQSGRNCPQWKLWEFSGCHTNKKMGLPLNHFIASSNSNNIIPEFLETGQFCPRPSVKTLANAMDVGNPSNFERMIYLYDEDFSAITSEIKGFWCNDKQIKTAIKTIFNKYHYISDPHSAIGYAASEHYQSNGFWVSTAHAAKFGEVINDVLPESPILPKGLANLKNKEKHFSSMQVDTNILTDFLSKL